MSLIFVEDQIYAFLGPNDSQFGFSSSISKHGETVAIGGPLFHDKETLNQGIVKVFKLYENVEGVWESKDDFDLFGDEGDHFGHCLSLSEDGSTLAVGAPQLSSPNGKGYIIVYDLNTKEEIPKGFKIEGRVGSRIGAQVHIINATSITASSSTGNIRSYKFEDGLWVEQEELVIFSSSKESEKALSFSSASSGSFLTTGVSSKEEYEAGTISAYQLKNDHWVKRGNDLNGFSKHSSIQISEDGYFLAVGDENVRVFEWNGEEWERRHSSNEIKGGLISLPNDASKMIVARPTLSITEKGDSRGEVMTYKWKHE